ncbi:histidine kinase [Waterburya agarophytonicola K14]|uniref:Histidine kinase n=1 Tax=Waterburya agarophytonicola KI4 TaxID=2874699 RepID=A0A964BSN8_9CYAN|nr:histidine kinase [Waterburya agarophytonicola]MCC0177140.1 histidine kinase [Waterburya agarophytonicola KI4]
MEESRKDKIITNLQQAKQTGQLKTENIREIVKSAVSEAASEVKEGRTEITSLVQEAIAAVVEIFQDKKGEIKEEVSASIEGAIEGISSVRREAISSTQSQIQTLEAQVEREEVELKQEIDGALQEIQIENKDDSDKVKAAIAAAISNLENSEEVALLQKRYAQLKAQLAIVKANLAGNYGESYGNVNQYLDEAKTWYEKAKENPEVFTGKIEERQQEFESKLGETGAAIAKKEKQVKQLLKELWKSVSEVFRDRKDS